MTLTDETPAALAPEVAERLQQLSQRRLAAATMAGAPKPSTKARKGKRRHPARKTRIAVLALSLASTAGLAGAFAATDGPTSSVAVGSGGIIGAGSQLAFAPTAVNGDVFINKWGPVQVQATFGSSGELVAVDAVQVPFADGKSVRINNQAVPMLNSEAIANQDAQVDTVSGATYTSVDYEKSLQSAIDAARAGGITLLP